MSDLFDMHCHLDFADNCTDVAKECAGRINAVNATVVPSSYVSTQAKLKAYPGIRVALGMHPWWIADGHVSAAAVAHFENLVSQTALIGEVGLDYHGKRRATRSRQMEVLSRILQAVADNGDERLVFLHAVKSYSDMFGLLEHYGTHKSNTCVFHWFSGSRDDFRRALADGFMFSVGMRMVTRAQGELFARQIPEDRLLIETDNPPHEGMSWSCNIWEQEICDTARSLAKLRDTTEEHILQVTAENSRRLLRKFDAIPT